MRNTVTTVFDVLAKEDILKIIKEDQKMTKHKLKIQFNEPPETNYLEAKVHIMGPHTEKMIALNDQFDKEIFDDKSMIPGPKVMKFYSVFEIAMKPGN